MISLTTFPSRELKELNKLLKLYHKLSNMVTHIKPWFFLDLLPLSS